MTDKVGCRYAGGSPTNAEGRDPIDGARGLTGDARDADADGTNSCAGLYAPRPPPGGLFPRASMYHAEHAAGPARLVGLDRCPMEVEPLQAAQHAREAKRSSMDAAHNASPRRAFPYTVHACARCARRCSWCRRRRRLARARPVVHLSPRARERTTCWRAEPKPPDRRTSATFRWHTWHAAKASSAALIGHRSSVAFFFPSIEI